ncbi:flagellar biosynthesis protein FlhB [Entomospira culicis]|uniref:Flagellar biosynthetic protein FlhB n=2 Tax=Entomospira culicis TaxID=2719989 RepID=A0A968KU14_9SPIO|nr:flagellar biosynthesis protein FlhB [Entomospira culicis]NIZ18489.1 flagellar biosynthesis protein FlhB [Entomospira culicis]NIZ68705.1 flagellar biosynthesis protein FlhB [Entomospira culicis]WDI38933.1 flagellar biosynthesis protein FlhB [Entomospira culicis]
MIEQDKQYTSLHRPADTLTWFSLQHFAKAEDEGRTEDPTDRKKRKSREEGKVAKSADLTQALTLFVALLTLAFFGKYMVRLLAEMMHFYFSQLTDHPSRIEQPNLSGNLGSAFYSYYFRSVGPIFATTFIVAFVSMALQVGFVYAPKAIKPDFKKIAPNFAKYISKTFLSIEAIYNLFKSIFKVIIIGFVGYLTISSSINKLSVAAYSSISQISTFLISRIFIMMLIVSIFMLALAIIDFMFQRHQFKETIKMTKQEIKDEMKEDMGNPHVKSLMRQRMMELLRSSMIQNVPKADVIITNPTHFSVALEYTWGAPAPRVTAKGEDLMALKIREIAQANDVPLVENRPLARALYATVEIGDEVPEEFLKIVADILASLPKIQAKMRGN